MAANKWKLTLTLALVSLLAASLACSFLGGTGDAPQDALTEDDPAAGSESGSQMGQGAGSIGAVDSLDGVMSATVLIEAEGTFQDPEYGAVGFAGRGTGFIIDPAGIAVTNNHVVTGAGLVKVWLAGEGEPKNARILGVSECADLAVIDIEGEGYPYLTWSEQEIKRGLEVYAAGYPLGDPEFALTRGILSKLEADGDSAFASIDSVFMHDANINPGNSGGPLVDGVGKVVAINYAFNPQADQYFAIPEAQAHDVLQSLESGQDVDSIGLNGTAFISETGGLTGIWVASVESGSLADTAGIIPGDILTMMEGITLAQSGTMEEYCDVLQTHDLNDAISFEILRTSTDDGYLTGQLNGRPVSAGNGSNPVGGFGGPAGDSTGQAGYDEYMLVMDDTGAIQMEVPTSWSQVDGEVWWYYDEIPYASIFASPDLELFLESWDVPGATFNVSDEIAELGGYVQQLDLFSSQYYDLCEFDGRYNYEDQLYRGKYDWFVNCGGPGGPSYMMLSAVPLVNQTDYLILVEVQLTSEADLAALQRIWDTFQVVGVLP